MRRSAFRTAWVFVLIFSITFSSLAPSLADNNHNRLRVAFVGLKFDNLPQDIRNIASWRMAQLFEMQAACALSGPEALQFEHGRQQMAELVENQNAAYFFEFARQFHFDYVFSGTLANRSSDDHGIFLVGILNRYELASKQVHSYSFGVNYDGFGNELLKFKQEYIDTMTKAKNSGRKIWSKLFIGGIIIASAFLIRSLAESGAGGEESKRDRTPGDN